MCKGITILIKQNNNYQSGLVHRTRNDREMQTRNTAQNKESIMADTSHNGVGNKVITIVVGRHSRTSLAHWGQDWALSADGYIAAEFICVLPHVIVVYFSLDYGSFVYRDIIIDSDNGLIWLGLQHKGREARK